MNFIPLTSREDSEVAFQMFRARMIEDCQQFHRKLGYQGGYENHAVYWSASEKIWSVFDAKVAHGRYWCAFGTQHPEVNAMLNIVVECNPPLEGINRRCAGVFLRAGNEVFIAHSGKVGGGRKGVGKSAFVDSCPQGNWQTVQWTGDYDSEMIVIGGLRDKRLPLQMAEFVREVEQFKNAVAKGVKPPVSNETEPRFSPEFAGKRHRYTLRATIESSCDHGFVVNALEVELKRRGIKGIGKDRPRDLFVLSEKRELQFLFEAKTDLTTGSIYQAVGQLIFHTAGCEGKPKRVLVLPGNPNEKTRIALTSLGLEILTYRLNGTRVIFKNLDSILI